MEPGLTHGLVAEYELFDDAVWKMSSLHETSKE